MHGREEAWRGSRGTLGSTQGHTEWLNTVISAGVARRKTSCSWSMFTQGAPQRKQQQAEKKGGGGAVSARMRSWLFALATMVTELTDIHMVKMGPEWDMSWTGSALCLNLRTYARIQKYKHTHTHWETVNVAARQILTHHSWSSSPSTTITSPSEKVSSSGLSATQL